MICARENLESFKKQLKTALPGVFPLISALHKAGMIGGMRGIKLTHIGNQTEIQEVEQTEPPVKCCQDCQFFQKDSVGQGSGIGQCEKKVITRKLKYPKHDACEKFRGKENE